MYEHYKRMFYVSAATPSHTLMFTYAVTRNEPWSLELCWVKTSGVRVKKKLINRMYTSGGWVVV